MREQVKNNGRTDVKLTEEELKKVGGGVRIPKSPKGPNGEKPHKSGPEDHWFGEPGDPNGKGPRKSGPEDHWFED